MRLNINNHDLCALLKKYSKKLYNKKFKSRDYWEVDSKGNLWLNEYDPNTGERNFIQANSDIIYFWLERIIEE